MSRLLGICIDDVSTSSCVGLNAAYDGYLFLHDESHWFEGIVRASDSSSNNDASFVYGIYLPNNIIKIYMVVPGQTKPFIFTCVRDARFYEGSIGSEIKLGSEEEIGSCKISTGDIVSMKEKGYPEVKNIDVAQASTDLSNTIAGVKQDYAVVFHYLLMRLYREEITEYAKYEYNLEMERRKAVNRK